MGLLDTIVSFVRKPDASLEELEEQLTRASRAKMDAAAAVDVAQAAFDESGSPADERALRAALDEARRAESYLSRAERLYEAAVEREDAAKRAELEAERDRLAAALTDEALRAEREPFIAREAAAIIALANLRLERLERERVINRWRADLRRVREQLGEPIHGSWADVVSPPDATRVPVATRVLAHMDTLEVHDPRREWLREYVGGSLR